MISRPENEGKGSKQALAAAAVDAWWDTVIAGEADEPHPVHGERLKIRFKGGRMVISGELDSKRERDELVRQARMRIGRGVRELDASDLKVAPRDERRGVLDQTLVAAFPETDLASLVREYLIQRGVTPIREEIVQAGQVARLRSLLPDTFVPDAERALGKNKALLILRVDETDAFKVRRLLEEDTRSTWTIALPPELAGKAANG
jgi:hypothetical protein